MAATKKPNLWENDPTLVPMNAAAKARVKEATFEALHRDKMTPEQVRDKELAKDYAAWLAAQTQQ